jgi:large subunit ribosomal protein L15
MQSHELKRKNPNKKSRKVGRGGLRGKTSGRGHKGQKQHGSHGIRAEIRDQIKKIPKLRGRGKNSNKSIKPDAVAVNLATLNAVFSNGDTVSKATLLEKNILSGAQFRKNEVKILANGDLDKKLTIEGCKVSKSAEEKISKAGGSIV